MPCRRRQRHRSPAASGRDLVLGHGQLHRVKYEIANGDQMVGIFHGTVIALVQRAGLDLSARQLGAFLTCYLEAEAQTVHGLRLQAGDHARTRPVHPSSIWKTDPLD